MSLVREEGYSVAAEQQRFMVKVYNWMCLALTITGFVSFWVADTPALIQAMVMNQLLFFGLIIGELVLVGYLVTRLEHMSVASAKYIFIGYSILNGLTLSVIFVVYTAGSIAATFFVTAGTFAVMSAYGYLTKQDLTSVGNLCHMAVWGIIIGSLVNWFMHSNALYWVITYIGVLTFVGLVAYDTQKIKQMNIIGNEGTDEDEKEAIMGALTLYLDFINLFLFLLRILGKRK